MVLSCMDPRFQPIVYNYLKKRKLNGKYSAFTIAGSAIGVTVSKFRKWHKSFWDNIDISIKLHKIKKLIVINHYDCGAAKIMPSGSARWCAVGGRPRRDDGGAEAA